MIARSLFAARAGFTWPRSAGNHSTVLPPFLGAKRMDWTMIKPYAGDDTVYWIAGIYKVSTYDGAHFHAYFIQDHYKNWGDNPSKPPMSGNGYHSPFWPSLALAMDACKVHARTYTPKPHTVRRSDELLIQLLREAA
jgi:hypothetical protein